MYGLDGTPPAPRVRLPWLAGYEGSTPVRIGNAAADQLQLDVWGEVLDGLHLARDAGLSTDDDAWDLQVALLDHLEGHWDEPDNGLWEMRGPRRHFAHSKVMAWVGVDRAVHSGRAPSACTGRWTGGAALRDDDPRRRLHARLRPRPQTFTQSYGAAELDAALLLIPRVGFLPLDDPRVARHHRGRAARTAPTTASCCATDPQQERRRPARRRRRLPGLHLLAGRRAARHRPRPTKPPSCSSGCSRCATTSGLLSEEYDPVTGRQLGNTPQAFSHVGLVNSARQLSGHHTTTSDSSEEQRPHPAD